jgi:hypothetical protein
VATSFSVNNVAKLGIEKNPLTEGVANETGAFTFTSSESLQSDKPAVFSFAYHGDTYTGSYKGLAAIKIDAAGKLQKLAATAFSSLTKNGKPLVSLSKEADVFISVEKGIVHATVADETRSVKLVINK